MLSFQPNQINEVLTSIRNSGNYFFKNNRYVEALRKYKKADRYLNMFKNKYTWKEAERNGVKSTIEEFSVLNNLNIAAVGLKMTKFASVIEKCNEVIALDPQNSKALFRRGLAQKFLKNYDESLNDLKLAGILSPGDKLITQEVNNVQKLHKEYYHYQQAQMQNLFKY